MSIPLFLPRLNDAASAGITVLAADIGGTKTNVGLYTNAGNKLQLKLIDTFHSKRYSSFTAVLQAFAERNNIALPARLCVGIAGPIFEGRSKLTNLSWEVSCEALKQDLGFTEVHLLNDLEATAYGLAALPEEDLPVMFKGNDDDRGNVSVIAPGTGLGEAGIYWNGKQYFPFATEGGHSPFAAETQEDIELLQYSQKTIRPIIAWEDIIAGPGIYHLYKFYRQKANYPEPQWLSDAIKGGDPSAAVSHAASDQEEETAVKAMDAFVRYLARESSSLVLKHKATGGLYLGGGIPPKIRTHLEKPAFRKYFLESDKMGALLETVTVRLILNPLAALWGAAYYGAFGPEA